MTQFRAEAKRVSGKGRDAVSWEAQRPKAVRKACEGVNANLGDIVVGDVKVAQVFQLIECFWNVVEAVSLEIKQFQRVFDPLEGISVDWLDSVHSQVDPARHEWFENSVLETLNVVVIQLEVVHIQSAVEGVWRNPADEVLPHVELVQPLIVAEGSLGNRLDVVPPDREPGQAGQRLDRLQWERANLVVADAESVDRPRQAVLRDLSDVVVV